MTIRRRAATLDHLREQKSARWIALFRASLSGLLALGGMAFLVDALVDGRFENMRHFGTIAFDEKPVGFALFAIGWAGMVGLFALSSALLARQAPVQAHRAASTRSTNFPNR